MACEGALEFEGLAVPYFDALIISCSQKRTAIFEELN
jgi:hypothetical protein